MLTRTRTTAALAVALAMPFALSACTFSSNLTVPADDIATLAADTLEDQIGQRPDIDCGEDAIDVVEGNEITCLLTDPSTGTEFDTAITFTSVDGAEYAIDIQVAETPN